MWSNKEENLSNCWYNDEKITTFMTGDIKGSDHCLIGDLGKIPGWESLKYEKRIRWLLSY